MSIYIATVIKTGNSYALRVPKRYIDETNIELGQKVEIQPPVDRPKQNQSRIQQVIAQLQEINALSTIENPLQWQRAQRTDRLLPDREQ